MSLCLTKFQKRLCNTIQEGLPICSEPFADLAKFLNSDEKEVLQQAGELKKAGVIRRIGAVINSRALDMASTLVAAHIPEEKLHEIAKAVNSLEGVSHNYLRRHYYNLWFTLRGQSHKEIEATLSKLSARFGVELRSLPAKRIFKLDARFDAGGEGRLLGVEQPPLSEPVELNDEQKLILSRLQTNLEIVARPFDFLCSGGLDADECLRIVQQLIDKGVIRRIAAVVDHRKLGFVANVLFAGEVARGRIVEAGKALARFGIVSHCYQRKALKDWPYNLYAMMHSRSMGDIQRVIDKFSEAEGIDSFELLPTAAELKKQPVKHRFY